MYSHCGAPGLRSSWKHGKSSHSSSRSSPKPAERGNGWIGGICGVQHHPPLDHSNENVACWGVGVCNKPCELQAALELRWTARLVDITSSGERAQGCLPVPLPLPHDHRDRRAAPTADEPLASSWALTTSLAATTFARAAMAGSRPCRVSASKQAQSQRKRVAELTTPVRCEQAPSPLEVGAGWPRINST